MPVAKSCSFCAKEVRDVGPSVEVVVCSICVQYLITLSQKELMNDYGLAISKGAYEKARALRVFMCPKPTGMVRRR